MYINNGEYGIKKTGENIRKIDSCEYGKRRNNDGTINKTDEIRLEENREKVRPRKK